MPVQTLIPPIDVVKASMGTEVELKLVAPPRAMRDAMQMPWLRKLGIDEPQRKRLTTVYFDTRDFALKKNGVSLRVRKVEDVHLQTIKSSSAGPINREEWEHEIDDDRPKLRLARNTALAPILTG